MLFVQVELRGLTLYLTNIYEDFMQHCNCDFSKQGLCEQTVKVLQLMETEGIEPNLIMLNMLINAFGIAGRHLEALSVYHHIKDTVSLSYFA